MLVDTLYSIIIGCNNVMYFKSIIIYNIANIEY